VLVRPYGGVNVGAVCRAMANMAAGDLWVVEPAFDPETARRAAAHARDVLDARHVATSIEEALAGCGLVVGTTARRGAYRSRTRDIREVAAEIAAAEQSGKAVPALVFGPEDTGLTNRDIACCHVLASIPTDAGYPSLNLAQAAVISLYECFRARSIAVSEATAKIPERADAGEIEAMYGALGQALLGIGFLSAENPEHIMLTLRGLLGRAGLDERELRVLRGLARQILWFAEGGHEVARRKKELGRKLR